MPAKNFTNKIFVIIKERKGTFFNENQEGEENLIGEAEEPQQSEECYELSNERFFNIHRARSMYTVI